MKISLSSSGAPWTHGALLFLLKMIETHVLFHRQTGDGQYDPRVSLGIEQMDTPAC